MYSLLWWLLGLSLAAGGAGSTDDDGTAADEDDDTTADADAGGGSAGDVVVGVSGVDVTRASFLALTSSFHAYNANKLSSSLRSIARLSWLSAWNNARDPWEHIW